MQLRIKNTYKSLPKDLTIELPDFAIITGENGSGKTHLLQYIKNHGIDDIKQDVINFVPSDWKAYSTQRSAN